MELQTARLLLRPFAAEDIPAAYAYLSDPAVMAYIAPPFDLAETAAFIQQAAISRALIHALCLRENGALLGHVIFHPLEAEDIWEMGWLLRRDAWGRGYAWEISQALEAYARARGFHMLAAEAVPDNLASVHLLRKLGMVQTGVDPQGLLQFQLSL